MNYTSDNLGTLNPFRYRGYYYDEDSNLYYLQSRYYDPDICKFINADDPIIVLNYSYDVLSLYTYDYCAGNPVMYVDYNGYLAILATAAAIAATSATLRLSMVMYLYSVSGSHFKKKLDLSSWYNPLGILLRNRLRNSKLINNQIVYMIKKKKWSTSKLFYFASSGGNTADFDLSMSVGHAYVSIKIKKTNSKQFVYFGKTKYIITINLSHTYDFRLFSKKDAGVIKRAINNYLGYWPQQLNVLKPYDFKINYSFNFYY